MNTKITAAMKNTAIQSVAKTPAARSPSSK
jgi:hypothetical protein